MTIKDLPTINAILNSIATVFLFCGWYSIKYKKNHKLHAKFMIAALVTSAVFLACYLYYHFNVELVTKYQGQGVLRYIYFSILLTHIPLAAIILPFIIAALWFAYKQNFAKHIRLTKWVWPVWMYVSITGVLIYLMLYVWS